MKNCQAKLKVLQRTRKIIFKIWWCQWFSYREVLIHKQFCYRFRYDKYNNQSSWATWTRFWTLLIFEFSRSKISSRSFPPWKTNLMLSIVNKPHMQNVINLNFKIVNVLKMSNNRKIFFRIKFCCRPHYFSKWIYGINLMLCHTRILNGTFLTWLPSRHRT